MFNSPSVEQQCKIHLKIPPNSFFMVIPFLRDLKKWVGHKHRERMQFLVSEEKTVSLTY